MTRKWYAYPLAIVILICLLVPGCLEITTTTKVKTDGALARTVVISDDSSSIYGGEYPIQFDSTWAIHIQKKTGSRSFELTATKSFQDADEMNNALRGVPGKKLSYRVSLERSFLWFFTDFKYRETLSKFNQFNNVPITDYLSKREIASFINHEVNKEPFASKADSLAFEDAEHRLGEWNARNLFEAYYNEFLNGVKMLKDKVLTPTYVAEHIEKLFESCKESAGDNIKGNQDTLAHIFQRVLKTPAVHKAIAMNAKGFQAYNEKLQSNYDMFSKTINTNIIMPGLITGTNASSVEGSKACWNDHGGLTYLIDYEMWVESRVTNWWAIMLTGVVVVAALLFLLIMALRRQRAVRSS